MLSAVIAALISCLFAIYHDDKNRELSDEISELRVKIKVLNKQVCDLNDSVERLELKREIDELAEPRKSKSKKQK